MAVDFDFFLGKTFVLDAVDTDPPTDAEGAIYFRLDGMVYAAVENDNDDLRSSLDCILEIGRKFPLKNVFSPCHVVGREGEADDDTVDFIDVHTKGLVLSVGTDNGDDYYPSFVAFFDPTQMASNDFLLAAEQARVAALVGMRARRHAARVGATTPVKPPIMRGRIKR